MVKYVEQESTTLEVLLVKKPELKKVDTNNELLQKQLFKSLDLYQGFFY